MLIPWNTDAPIYHFPYATIGVIVLNVLVFGAIVVGGTEAAEDWVLWHGDGLHPLQWVSSNFIHGDFLHLAGNMIFLWGFGLVVEGKIGWWRFLDVFMGIGIVQSAVEQLCALGMEGGGSYGASAVIYGLLAMALVWAPKNDMSCILVLGFRIATFDLSILMFAGIYLVIELITAWFVGRPFSSAVLHLSGAGLGLIVGIAMLKMGLVNCENWDIFALWSDRLGKSAHEDRVDRKAVRRQKAKQSGQPQLVEDDEGSPPPSTAAEQAARTETASRAFRDLLHTGGVDAAATYLSKVRRDIPGFELSEGDLLAWIKALHERKSWQESLPWMVEYLRRFPEKCERVRLKLAQLLVTEFNRPGQALSVLQKLPAGPLAEPLQAAREKLTRQATQMQEQSEAFEVGLNDW